MEESSKQLLKECDSGCKMAVESMEQLLEYVKSDSLKEILSKYKQKHQEIQDKAEDLLAQQGEEGKEPSLPAEAFSWMTTKIKMSMYDDDRKIAEILMNGCNMGIQSICRVQNKHKDASKESISLAENLVRTEEELQKELKAYL